MRKHAIHLIVSFVLLACPVLGTSGGECSEFSEDFSGLSPNEWQGGGGNWYFSGETLVIQDIDPGSLAFAETGFHPADYFTIDVTVDKVQFPSGSSFGIYPFTSGDVFFDVDGHTVDGLGALLFQSGSAYLFGWDLDAGDWYQSEALDVTGAVLSIGLKYAGDSITLRINGQDTSLRKTGSFGLGPSVLDTLWLVAQGEGAQFRFDNICASPLAAPVQTRHLLIQKSGDGQGTVVSAPPGISCGSDCSEDYSQGTQVALTAQPDLGSQFSGWSGGGCSGKAGCQVTMSVDRTVTAAFDLAAAPAISKPKLTLYFPFYQADSSSFTGFAVSNDSSSTARVEFRGMGLDGQLLPFNQNPRVFDLPAHQQLAKLGWEIFGASATAPQSGWVELVSDNPDIGSFFQFGGTDQLDGSVPFEEQSKKLYFTRIFEGSKGFRGRSATTYISLANPNTEPITVAFSLFGTNHNQVLASPKTRTIPARGGLYDSVSNLFGKSLSVSSGYLVADVTDGAGAVGFALVKLPTSKTLIGINAASTNNSNELYSAQLASLDGFFTSVKLVNVSNSERTVTLTPVNENGGQLASPKTVVLASGEALESDVADLFGWNSSNTYVGSLTIEANSSGVVGDVLFGDARAATSAAALPLQTRRFVRGVFSQVASGLGLFTGLAFYNPGTADASITIDVYTGQGTRSGHLQPPLILKPGERVSQLVDQLLPSTANQIGGYVVVQSSQPLIAQQLFGSGSLLSAVPPMVPATSVTGPGGSYVSLADQSERAGVEVTVTSADSSQIVESGDRPVSGAIRISTGSSEALGGDGYFHTVIPVTATGFAPDRLTAKVRIKSGEVLPVQGVYDATAHTYEISTPGLDDGWVVGVVENDAVQVVESPLPSDYSPAGWLTPPEWETCRFEIVNHTDNVTANQIETVIRPALESACSALSNAGFRSPKLWVDNRLDPPARVVHVVPNIGSKFFAGEWKSEEDPQFTLDGLTEDQMSALGQIYIDYGQYQTLHATYGVTLENIAIHEMLHGVQAGYDIRNVWVNAGTAGHPIWRNPRKAYMEGTSTPVGQTFQEKNSISGPNLSVRRLHEGEFAFLNERIDEYKYNFYTKQDLFAWLASKYFNGNWSYAHLMFEQLGLETTGKWGLGIDAYHQLYRNALDDFLRAKAKKPLAEIYSEFALDRAYEHSAKGLLRPAEKTDFKKNKLAASLFNAAKGGIKQLQPESADAATRKAVFPKIESLSTYVVVVPVPESFRSGGSLPLDFKLTGGELKPEGIQIHVFKEGANGVMLNGGAIALVDIDKTVQIPVDANVQSLTVLILNCYVQERSVQAEVSVPAQDRATTTLIYHGKVYSSGYTVAGYEAEVGVEGTSPELEWAEPGSVAGESCCSTYWSTLGGKFAVTFRLIRPVTDGLTDAVEFRGFTKAELYTDDFGEERTIESADPTSFLRLADIPYMDLGDGDVASRTVRVRLTFRYYIKSSKDELDGTVGLQFWVFPYRVQCEQGYCEKE